jgi:hypothetical protein
MTDQTTIEIAEIEFLLADEGHRMPVHEKRMWIERLQKLIRGEQQQDERRD